MRDKTIDVLLQMGVPASIKGFTYICDAIELFDTDPYYPDGKICSFYSGGRRFVQAGNLKI